MPTLLTSMMSVSIRSSLILMHHQLIKSSLPRLKSNIFIGRKETKVVYQDNTLSVYLYGARHGEQMGPWIRDRWSNNMCTITVSMGLKCRKHVGCSVCPYFPEFPLFYRKRHNLPQICIGWCMLKEYIVQLANKYHLASPSSVYNPDVYWRLEEGERFTLHTLQEAQNWLLSHKT